MAGLRFVDVFAASAGLFERSISSEGVPLLLLLRFGRRGGDDVRSTASRWEEEAVWELIIAKSSSPNEGERDRGMMAVVLLVEIGGRMTVVACNRS